MTELTPASKWVVSYTPAQREVIDRLKQDALRAAEARRLAAHLRDERALTDLLAAALDYVEETQYWGSQEDRPFGWEVLREALVAYHSSRAAERGEGPAGAEPSSVGPR